MPVILNPGSYDSWLDPGMTNVQVVSELLKPYDPKSMRCYPVSTRINHVANDDENARAPWTSPKPRMGFSPEDIKSCECQFRFVNSLESRA